MSSGYDYPLMWSHYADKHRGVCLGFRRDKEKERSEFYYPILGRVDYNKPRIIKFYEILNCSQKKPMNGMSASLFSAFFSKAPSW